MNFGIQTALNSAVFAQKMSKIFELWLRRRTCLATREVQNADRAVQTENLKLQKFGKYR